MPLQMKLQNNQIPLAPTKMCFTPSFGMCDVPAALWSFWSAGTTNPCVSTSLTTGLVSLKRVTVNGLLNTA